MAFLKTLRSTHPDSFPAYFTKQTHPRIGWPFVLALLGILISAFGSLALM